MLGETIEERMLKLRPEARSDLEFWRYIARCSEKKAAVISQVVGQPGGTQEQLTAALQGACDNV